MNEEAEEEENWDGRDAERLGCWATHLKWKHLREKE